MNSWFSVSPESKIILDLFEDKFKEVTKTFTFLAKFITIEL